MFRMPPNDTCQIGEQPNIIIARGAVNGILGVCFRNISGCTLRIMNVRMLILRILLILLLYHCQYCQHRPLYECKLFDTRYSDSITAESVLSDSDTLKWSTRQKCFRSLDNVHDVRQATELQSPNLLH